MKNRCLSKDLRQFGYIILTTLFLTISTCTLVAQDAYLMHRYTFNNNVRDVASALHGLATSPNDTTLEAPSYTVDVPAGGIVDAPANSIEFGVNIDSGIQSGFKLDKAVINKASGSVSVWMKADTIASTNYIYRAAYLDSGPTFKGYSGNKVSLTIAQSGNTVEASVTNGTWHHVVTTWNNSSGSSSLYLDGNFVGNASFPSGAISPFTVFVGNWNNAGTKPNTQYDGKLYDMQFYSEELSAPEVRSLYSNPGGIIGTPPQRAEARLVYPTMTDEDVVVADLVVSDAPYSADNKGDSDCTDAVQNAINALKASGGGTLYFPAGKYKFSGTLTLPGGVSLRGDWCSPNENGSGEGTIFMIYAGRNNADAAPFIYLDGGTGGIQNLSFWYPEQHVDNIVPYPPTILRNNLPVMLKRLTFYNSYTGLEVEYGGGAAVITEIFGTFLKKGIQSDLSAEYGIIDQICISPLIWANAPQSVISNAPELTAIQSWCSQNTVGIEILHSDNTELFQIKVEDAEAGIRFDKSPRAEKSAYGLRKDIDATVDIRELTWVSNDYGDVDRYENTHEHTYVWPEQWKPARTDVLINVRNEPYGAKGDAKTDDTRAIQHALDDAKTEGGGIVYLPPGEYVILTNLVVPGGVELRGASDFVDRGNMSQKQILTSLHAFQGGNSTSLEEDPPFISLSANSSLRGLTIYYPEQNEFWPSREAAPPKTYPWAIRGLGHNINVQYVTVKRAWDLIDFASHDCSGFVVQDMWASPLNRGICVGGGTDGGHLQRVLQSMGAWYYPGISAPDIPDWTPEIGSTWLWENASDQFLSNSKAYIFGDAKNIQGFSAISYRFNRHLMFINENGKGPENIRMYLCPSEMTGDVSILCEKGDNLHLYGMIVNPVHTGYLFETTDEFDGTFNVYGITHWGNGAKPLIRGGRGIVHPVAPPQTNTAYVSPNESKGLLKRSNFKKVNYRDDVLEIQGKKCWQISPFSTSSNTYVLDIWVDYFQLRYGQTPEVTLSFEYLDKGSGTIQVIYDGNNSTGTNGGDGVALSGIQLQNTNTWKTASYNISDARFMHNLKKMGKFNDIAIFQTGATTPLTIASVSLKTLDYLPVIETPTHMLSDDIMESATVELYPNPFNDQLNIKADEDYRYLEIFDVSGKVLFQHTITSPEFSVYPENLENGIYIIKCYGNNKVFAEIMIKANHK